MRFKRIRVSIALLLVLFSGRPEDRTQRGSVISRTWATSPRRPFLSRAPRGRTAHYSDKRGSWSQTRRAPNCTSARCCFVCSVRTVGFEPTISSSPNWRDNQASLRSDVSSPYGNRTHLSALKERYPAPIDERAVLCRCVRLPFTPWTGRRSNPRLLLFRQAPGTDRTFGRVSATSPCLMLDESTKKARCRDDTGLCVIRKITAECHKRNGCDGVFACS